MKNNIFKEFEWRGMIYDNTEGLEHTFMTEHLIGYIGFDPTAPSLHVGSLLPLMGLARFQRFGHTPIGLLGGGTGLIGDPSGKSSERSLLSKEEARTNLTTIKQQICQFLDFDTKINPATIVDNSDWLIGLELTDFLRDIGKHFSVNSMLSKESVRRRLEQEQGLSYTEFAYSLLQAYDYLILWDKYKCNLQMGGSDQWGNIVAGIDLIRKLRGQKTYGLVYPLITNAAGTKFGKTESGTIWLDANLTSPFHFYQFWLNTDDKDVVSYLKYFTWLSADEIRSLAFTVDETPERREAQQRLAQEITKMVHGDDALKQAEKASQVFFGAVIEELTMEDVMDIFDEMPSTEISITDVNKGKLITELFTQCGLTSSKGDARRLITSGGAYLNNRRIADDSLRIDEQNLIDGQLLVLRKGQKNYHIVRVTDIIG